MLSLLEATVKPLQLKTQVLEVAYELFSQAPQADYPVINLRELSQRTGVSLLECRNAIVDANKVGRFPNCSLHS